MMHCKRTVTTVQRGHTRIIKVLILWLNVFNTGEIEYDLTTGKKFTYEALAIALEKKKNSKLVTNFPDFTSIFKTFFRSEKLLGKFQEFKTLYEPWKEPRCKGNLPVLAASDMMATSFVPFIKLFLCDTMQSKKQRLIFNYTQTTL